MRRRGVIPQRHQLVLKVTTTKMDSTAPKSSLVLRKMSRSVNMSLKGLTEENNVSKPKIETQKSLLSSSVIKIGMCPKKR